MLFLHFYILLKGKIRSCSMRQNLHHLTTYARWLLLHLVKLYINLTLISIFCRWMGELRGILKTKLGRLWWYFERRTLLIPVVNLWSRTHSRVDLNNNIIKDICKVEEGSTDAQDVKSRGELKITISFLMVIWFRTVSRCIAVFQQ